MPGVHNEKTILIRNKAVKIVRKIEISEDMIELLTRFIKLYRKKSNQQDPLLESERGNRFGYMSLYNKVRRIGDESGISPLSPTILRHTYVMRLFDTEQDLRYVQEQAGYTSCRTISKYVKIDQKLNTIQTCEACGAKITTDGGKRIESGQLICHKCQKYFCTA